MENIQEQEPSTNYVKGFNEGYTIAKYLPDVADKLSDILGNSERAKGFQLGRTQYLLEAGKEKVKEPEKYPEWLKDSYSSNVREPEITKDKDDIEIEK